MAVNSLSVHDFLMSRRGIRPGRKPNCWEGLLVVLVGLVESVVWISLMLPSLSMMRFVFVDGAVSAENAAVALAEVVPTVFSAQVEASTLQYNMSPSLSCTPDCSQSGEEVSSGELHFGSSESGAS